MKKLLLSILLFYTISAQAQLTVKSGVAKEVLVSAFAKMGVTVSNISISAASNSYGTFSNGNTTNLGINEGIVLTTGRASNSIGPNFSGSSGSCNGLSGNDPQLSGLSSMATEDISILEFDVVPQCNQLTLSFVFGSEEYPEFVGAEYNDAFGLFLSGPGPACQAGYYNNTNVATLPDNSTTVSIDNVNSGKNSAYFVNNISGGTIEYDGFTKKITRTISVCPCQTYHFKIAIGDAGDCYYDSGVFIELFQCNNPLDASIVAQPACSTNGGSATVTATGQGPFTYSWSPAPGGGQGTTTATGLTAGATYTVTVNDGLACSPAITRSIIIPSISVTKVSQSDITCNGYNNGSAKIAASGGTAPYTYSWAPSGGTGLTASNLKPGNYIVTATDANGCEGKTTITISEPAPFLGTPEHTDVACKGASTGSATIKITGGTPNYTYLWNTGETSATASELKAGSYSVTAKDANNCQLLQFYTIAEPATSISISNSSQTNVSCNGDSNGSASVTTEGGSLGYTYSWAPSGGTGATASGLKADTYTVTVKDANNCSLALTESFTITEPNVALSVSNSSQTDVLCNGASTGSASVTIEGGTPNYTYAWAPSGGTAATASGLKAGIYTVTVKDANNCSLTKSFTITEPNTALSVSNSSQTDVLCNGAFTGSASITVTGGIPNYTYAWAPSGGTAAIASELKAETYTVTVKDANNCSLTKSFTITEPNTALSVSNSSQTDVLCNGASTGSASVTIAGGTPNYTYTWTPSVGTTAITSELKAGTYTVEVKDANNCRISKSFTITEPALITKSQVLTICANESITVGTNTYSVSGNYTDVLVAKDGCDSIVHTDLSVKPSIDVTIAIIDNRIEATTSNAIYQWLDCTKDMEKIEGITSQSYTPLTEGSYALIVSEDNCSDTSACLEFVPTAITHSAYGSINVYPNPSNGIFTIAGLGLNTAIRVYDIHGRLIKEVSKTDHNATLDLSGEQSGLYLIKITQSNYDELMLKITKQ